jgi:hypothetical protein
MPWVGVDRPGFQPFGFWGQTPMSQKRDMGHPVLRLSFDFLGDEVDGAEDAGGDGLDFV